MIASVHAMQAYVMRITYCMPMLNQGKITKFLMFGQVLNVRNFDD